MILSIDIGGMSTKLAKVNLDHEIVWKKSVKYEKMISWNELSNLLKESIKNEININEIDSINISCPGAVNCDTGQVIGTSAISGLANNNLKDFFKENFKKNVYIDNDSNCAALAELKLGNAQNCKNALVFVIGTGIGCSVILNNQVFKGTSWRAGEIGNAIERFLNKEEQTKINLPFLPTSTYGMYGTSIRYQMLTGVKKSVVDLIANYDTDENVKKIIDGTIEGLAKVICNTTLVTNPSKVVIGGGVSENKHFIKLLTEKINFIYINLFKISEYFEVCHCKFYNDANLIGAALLKE